MDTLKDTLPGTFLKVAAQHYLSCDLISTAKLMLLKHFCERILLKLC